jgi:hypothetical protein
LIGKKQIEVKKVATDRLGSEKTSGKKKTKLRIFLGSARAAVGRRAVHQFGSGKTKDIKTDRNKKKVQQIQFGKKPASKKDQN